MNKQKQKCFVLVFLIFYLLQISFAISLPSGNAEYDKDAFSSAQKAIKQKAEDVAKQVEIYIKSNPELTVLDLQNDSYFQNIAVQPVGKTGYTAL